MEEKNEYTAEEETKVEGIENAATDFKKNALEIMKDFFRSNSLSITRNKFEFDEFVKSKGIDKILIADCVSKIIEQAIEKGVFKDLYPGCVEKHIYDGNMQDDVLDIVIEYGDRKGKDWAYEIKETALKTCEEYREEINKLLDKLVSQSSDEMPKTVSKIKLLLEKFDDAEYCLYSPGNYIMEKLEVDFSDIYYDSLFNNPELYITQYEVIEELKNTIKNIVSDRDAYSGAFFPSTPDSKFSECYYKILNHLNEYNLNEYNLVTNYVKDEPVEEVNNKKL